MNALLEGRRVLATRARSFRWAAWWLGRRAHDEAALVYGFCRLVDDAADDAASPHEARAALARVARALGGHEHDARVQAYLALAARRGFGSTPAMLLLAGATSDADLVRVADDRALIAYAYRVAGSVGLMMCSVLGASGVGARPHAVALGIGMQLTNICRDVREDALMGRVYLPASRFGAVRQDELVTAVRRQCVSAELRASVQRVVRELLVLADDFYFYAEAGLVFLPPRARLAVMVASRLYRAIGLRLTDPLRGRRVVPWCHKVGCVLAALCAWLGTLLPRRRLAV